MEMHRSKFFLETINFKTMFPFLGLFGVIAFFQIYTGGRVLTLTNYRALISECFFIIIGVTGYIFIMAQGGLDFSVGSVMGLCCAIAAAGAGIHPMLAVPVAVLTGSVIGLINGLLIVKLKVGSLIGTMSTGSIVSGILILSLADRSLSAPIAMLQWNAMTVRLAVILLVVIAGLYLFNFTVYGKGCRAIGSCAEAAKQSGVKVGKIKIMAFTIMGALAGLLGFFSLIRTGTVTVLTGSELFMNVLCAALLGGIPLSGGAGTKFSSVIVGSLTMAFLANGMVLMGLSTYDKQLINGIVFLITIAISFDRKNMIVIK